VRGPGAEQVRILFTTADNKLRRSGGRDAPHRRRTPAVPGGPERRERPRTAAEPDVRDRGRRRADARLPHPGDATPLGPRRRSAVRVFPRTCTSATARTRAAISTAWEGALVTLGATANMPVKLATVVLTDSEDPQAKGEEISMQVVEGTKLSGEVEARIPQRRHVSPASITCRSRRRGAKSTPTRWCTRSASVPTSGPK